MMLMSSGPTFADAMTRPRNNFTVVRLALALAVVVSHAFSVTTGRVEGEPLAALTGFTLGEHAVNGFFAISGFLVTMSFDRRAWWDYVIARALRIAPGLVVATLAVGLALGGAMTRLPLGEYLIDSGLWRFVAATPTTFKSNIALPGVFEQNPFKFPIGTVWTLKYEVLCYVGVLVLGFLGLLRSKAAALALVVGLSLAVAGLDFARPDAAKSVETALRLPLIFACGGALYLWRDRARLSGGLALAGIAVTALLSGTFLYQVLLFLSASYTVLWLAFAPMLVRWIPEPEADLSYGVYLYGWPLQQTLHALFPGASALVLLGPSIVLALTVAALSWFMVEKPALRLKARALERRIFNVIEPAAP